MKTSQLKEAEESTCALRFKATSLKEEVAQAKAEAAGSNKLPNQLLQVLQSELKAEERPMGDSLRTCAEAGSIGRFVADVWDTSPNANRPSF